MEKVAQLCNETRVFILGLGDNRALEHGSLQTLVASSSVVPGNDRLNSVDH